MFYVGLALLAVGVGLRLWAWRPFLDAYAKRYGEAPPRSWLWTAAGDPAVERYRRSMVAGSAILLAGAVALLVATLP